MIQSTHALWADNQNLRIEIFTHGFMFNYSDKHTWRPNYNRLQKCWDTRAEKYAVCQMIITLPSIMVISYMANIVQGAGGLFYLGLGYPKIHKKQPSVPTVLQPILYQHNSSSAHSSCIMPPLAAVLMATTTFNKSLTIMLFIPKRN